MTTTREIEIVDPSSLTPNSDQSCGCDADSVARYAAAMKAGAVLPPVVAVREWMEVRDGCHRLAAAKLAGVPLRVIFISRDEYREMCDDGVSDCDLTDEIA